MPDAPVAPAAAPTTTPTASNNPPAAPASRRNRSLVNQDHAIEISLAGEIANTAALPAYATSLAGEGIDAAFLTNFRAKIAEASALMTSAVTKTSAKEASTRLEETRKDELLVLIGAIQTRAKRKYEEGDARRDNYFIGELLNSRTRVETAARSIIGHLATDTLPGLKAGDVPALQAALDAYMAAQTEQLEGQSGASSARANVDATVKELTRLRREIQYAVDALWPAKKPGNAAIRVEFKLPPDRALR